MKILIADDEELVRVGLKDVLGTISEGDEVFEAVNGRTLIEQTGKISPDICFVDIRMPGISGLDAIEALTEEFSDISWIILSGYSDFEYVRKALNLGAVDFLLKPATEPEVRKALLKAAEKRIDAVRLKREKFEYRLGGVLNNSSAAEFDDYLLGMEKYAAMVFSSAGPDLSMSAESLRALLSRLRRRIDSFSSRDYAGVFNIQDGNPAVIAAGTDPARLLGELFPGGSGEFSDAGGVMFSPETGTLGRLLISLEGPAEAGGGAEAAGDIPECSSRLVRQAEKLLGEMYTEPIGVAQIAEELNVTPNYLSALFKKSKGVSFTKFITDMRLSEAPEIMKTPGITVKEVASNLGYMSSRHFTRLFRERYGMTPVDYINKNS